jgi:CheY-like chemotaxis protein
MFKSVIAIDPPALLITDLNMTSGDGWELIAFCSARYPQLPILIVSGLPPGTRPEIECYARGYLTKPFGNRTLLAEVARFLPADAAISNIRRLSTTPPPAR